MTIRQLLLAIPFAVYCGTSGASVDHCEQALKSSLKNYLSLIQLSVTSGFTKPEILLKANASQLNPLSRGLNSEALKISRAIDANLARMNPDEKLIAHQELQKIAHELLRLEGQSAQAMESTKLVVAAKEIFRREIRNANHPTQPRSYHLRSVGAPDENLLAAIETQRVSMHMYDLNSDQESLWQMSPLRTDIRILDHSSAVTIGSTLLVAFLDFDRYAHKATVAVKDVTKLGKEYRATIPPEVRRVDIQANALNEVFVTVHTEKSIHIFQLKDEALQPLATLPMIILPDDQTMVANPETFGDRYPKLIFTSKGEPRLYGLLKQPHETTLKIYNARSGEELFSQSILSNWLGMSQQVDRIQVQMDANDQLAVALAVSHEHSRQHLRFMHQARPGSEIWAEGENDLIQPIGWIPDASGDLVYLYQDARKEKSKLPVPTAMKMVKPFSQATQTARALSWRHKREVRKLSEPLKKFTQMTVNCNQRSGQILDLGDSGHAAIICYADQQVEVVKFDKRTLEITDHFSREARLLSERPIHFYDSQVDEIFFAYSGPDGARIGALQKSGPTDLISLDDDLAGSVFSNFFRTDQNLTTLAVGISAGPIFRLHVFQLTQKARQ